MTKVSFMEKTKDYGGRFLAILQKIGKSLVFPISVLPAAALLLRIGVLIQSYGTIDGSGGQQFSYWLGTMLSVPGAAAFDNLPILFAIGIGFGMSKDKRGEAALVSFVTYMAYAGLVNTEKTSLTNLIYGNAMVSNGHSKLLYLTVDYPDASGVTQYSHVWLTNMGVFGGISAGIFTAYLYNNFSEVKLHPALGFFSGRRFTPLVALSAVVPFAFVTAIVWPWFNLILMSIGQGMAAQPEVGAAGYAFFNRLLIPFGLHQILNSYFWFQIPIEGELVNISPLIGKTIEEAAEANVIVLRDQNGQLADPNLPIAVGYEVIVLGDITGFNQGVTNSGVFQSGYFPIMMFGLPAVGYAIARNSDEQYRKPVTAFMLTAGAVSFVTGITEPLEFTFAFIAPMLYLAYAALSSVVAGVTVATGARYGYAFSAGFVDLMISIPMAAELSTGVAAAGGGYMSLVWIFIIGIAVAPIYYFMTDIIIKKMDLPTPGRKGNLTGVTAKEEDDEVSGKKADKKWVDFAKKTIELVGADNIKEIDNFITRLRLTVKDNSKITKDAAHAIGYQGYVKTGKTQAHFIIGPEAEIIAAEMAKMLKK